MESAEGPMAPRPSPEPREMATEPTPESTRAESSEPTPEDPETSEPAPSRHCIPCPYDRKHLVALEDFNGHVWKCRTQLISFYPHKLKMKRCQYNTRHFLPEQELHFHEIFCKSQVIDLQNLLATDPLHLDVVEYLAAQKLQKQLEADNSDTEDEEVDSDSDSDEERKKKTKSVTSEVEMSDVEEDEDMEVMMKRLEYLEIKKNIE
ncbi:hypothetical protein CAEBREN_18835 [Caenorhabditis brenneri]|uniref:CHHC U11-48K-type domain-containing protein n=1 Tax=Caenorhabditis brenneri TaxID=135651 RepID=G0MR13_CAEBE|nr:hypothetical protein CAEBREN_18835 [Caenorhabditis brenneri]